MTLKKELRIYEMKEEVLLKIESQEYFDQNGRIPNIYLVLILFSTINLTFPFLGFSWTPILSRPMLLVQASLPIANTTELNSSE